MAEQRPATAQPGYGADTASEEELLVSHLNRVRGNPSGYFAVHLHLSKLRPGNRQPQFISLAAKTFENFTAENEAILFPLYNADFVLICRNIPIEDVDPIIEKVRALFSEDPLTAAEIGSYDDRFTTWYDLSQPDDFRAFYAAAHDLAAAAEAQREQDRQAAAQRVSETEKGTPLAPDNLAAIDQKMKSTQVADLIRNQAVYKVNPGGRGEIVFREYFVTMSELKNRVAPNVNLFGSPWLFQYLTETLDRRVLAVVSRRDMAAVPEPISMNLNIGTVLSREFQHFHDSVEDHASKIIVEMQVIDIFADLTTFGYARDFLQERGYKVLIDGLNPLSIHFFDPAMLRADFLKIAWGPEFVGEEQDDRVAEMREVLKHAGKDGVILSRVDSQDAVKWGASLGIARFQGYFIDKLVAAMRAQKGVTGTSADGQARAPSGRKAAVPPSKQLGAAAKQPPAQAAQRPAAPAQAPAQAAPSAQPARQPAQPAPARRVRVVQQNQNKAPRGA